MSNHMNADDKKRYDYWVEWQNKLGWDEDGTPETPMDRLRFLRAMSKFGMHVTFGEGHQPSKCNSNPSPVAPLILPNPPNHQSGSAEARALESAWEIRCDQMHQNQVPVELPDKPRENELNRRVSAVATFEMAGDNESSGASTGKRKRVLKVPLFHQSPASTEVQRRTKRGN